MNNFIEDLKSENFNYGLSIKLNPEIDFKKIKEIKKPLIKITENEIKIEIKEKNSLDEIEINLKENEKRKILINIFQKEETIAFIKLKISLGKNSNVDITQIQEESKKSKLFLKKEFILQENSKVESRSLILGRDYQRQENNFLLKEKNSSVKDTILYLAKEDNQFDLYNSSIHSGEETKSDLKIRGIVTDKSKSVSRSLIRINENAINCEGYEKQESLIMSEEAESDAIPNLEINNNQVKCSHGATIGQIDQESIFYLMSRGLTKKQAESTIIEGYFNPILDKLSDENIKLKIKDSIKV